MVWGNCPSPCEIRLCTGYNGTFSQLLALGNFRIFAISGQTPSEESDLLGDKILGYQYDLESDVMGVKFPINLSKKRQSVGQ